MNQTISRREVLSLISSCLLTSTAYTVEQTPRYLTRGVVLYPWDLSLKDWPERASRAGITTIGLHAGTRLDVLIDYVKSDNGEAFLGRCHALGLEIEYEVHALSELLSREYWSSPDRDMFRMDSMGQRNPDSNCCPSSLQALEIISEKAVEYGRILKPTTGRYFFWPDDGKEWCQCPKCNGLTSSDQAIVVENAMIMAIRKHINPNATLSHISYNTTLLPPKLIDPHAGLFLEFAPIGRAYDRSIDDPDVKLGNKDPEPKSHSEYLEILDANLEVFGRESAQVLEYWLDVSRFSGWKRPAQRIPWFDAVMKADANAYARKGIRHVTTFATWIDADYVNRFGEPPLADYVQALQ
jgi:hypothetical protein